MMRLNENVARLNPDQLISSIYKKQDDPNYSKIFDDTLIGIAKIMIIFFHNLHLVEKNSDF